MNREWRQLISAGTASQLDGSEAVLTNSERDPLRLLKAFRKEFPVTFRRWLVCECGTPRRRVRRRAVALAKMTVTALFWVGVSSAPNGSYLASNGQEWCQDLELPQAPCCPAALSRPARRRLRAKV